jgi:hypothetical protein
MPKNLDNNPINVYVRASMNGGAAADGKINVIETTTGTASEGTVLQATTDQTELANATTLIQLTPTGTADGREIKIQAKVVNGADTVTIQSVFVTYGGSGSSATKGVKTSGFRTTGSALVYQSEANISTEHIESLINGPRQLAKDRPVCLASILSDTARTPTLTTTNTSYELVIRGMMPIPDHVPGGGRQFKVYAEMAGIGGATPAVKVSIDGILDSPEIEGTGWGSDTFKATNIMKLTTHWAGFQVYMKRTGGSRANLRALQIFRSF